MVLAVVAFTAAYGVLLVEGQTDRPVFHLYPWLVAVLLYFAGDLLALIWFKLVGLQLQAMLREADRKQRLEAEVQRQVFPLEEADDAIEV
jgi:hypothetical protein